MSDQELRTVEPEQAQPQGVANGALPEDERRPSRKRWPLQPGHEEWADQPMIRFFPDHLLDEVTNMFLLLSLYTVLVIFFPAELQARANPQLTPLGLKPEWYFLFLYALLHYVPPVVGTFAPFAGVGFLIAIPWIGRNPSRKLAARKLALTLCALAVVAVVVLTIIGIND